MALGCLQALSALGNMTAALVSAAVTALGLSWRAVYFVGAAPALLVLWIRSAVKEPERWQLARAAAAADPEQELGKMGQLFTDPVLRRNTVAGVLLGAAGVGGLWGVGFFLPDLTGSVLQPLVGHLPEKAAKAQVQQWRNQVFFIQQVGALLGMFSYAALSQLTGRRPALFLFFALAWGSVVATFWGIRDLTTACVFAFGMGFCALAPFAAYAVYFPELFPTRLRSTGVGFCYNCARILAAAAPWILGKLAAHYTDPGDPSYGFRMAATLVSSIYALGFIGLALAPETRGKPLPE
jgi:MFS family permease